MSAKFGGAAADLEYASRTLVRSHPSNPRINMQLVDNASSKQEQQPYETLDISNWHPKKELHVIVEEEEEEADGSRMNAYDKGLWSPAQPADKRISRSPESFSFSRQEVPEFE